MTNEYLRSIIADLPDTETREFPITLPCGHQQTLRVIAAAGDEREEYFRESVELSAKMLCPACGALP